MNEGEGMVTVQGITYRISLLAPNLHEVVRLIDDTRVGAFTFYPQLHVMAERNVDAAIIRSVALEARRRARLVENR